MRQEEDMQPGRGSEGRGEKRGVFKFQISNENRCFVAWLERGTDTDTARYKDDQRIQGTKGFETDIRRPKAATD